MSRQKRAAIVLIVALLIGAISVVWFMTKGGVSADQPPYQTIIPSDQTTKNWARVSPENSDPVYAYSDEIDGVTITVSEQPLPESFKNNAEAKVAELAKQYNATAELEVATTKVYIGTSANGPQSVIFTKSDLLVLIKSQKNISNTSWARYIASLN